MKHANKVLKEHRFSKNIKTFEGSSNDKKILNKISFELKPGRIVGIVGPNGAGKSSLLKLTSDLSLKKSSAL